MLQSCFVEAELTIFGFCTGKIRKILLELDPYDISLSFVKTADYLATKVSTVLCKLVRAGSFFYHSVSLT